MNKKIFSVALAAFAFAAVANADDNLTFNWAHVVDGATSAGDNVIGMVKAADGDYYVATTFGTTSSALNVNFDGETLTDASGNAIEGSPYTGTSNNANMLLQKVSPETGDVQWYIYTDKGYIEQGYTKMAASSDGGMVIAAKTRAWVADAGMDNLLEIVDATGATTTIKDMWTKSGEYRYIVFKVTSEGKLDWARLISGLCIDKGEMLKDGETTALKQATKDNCYVYGMTLDSNDNIYLCGNFRTELYFKKSDGTVVTLTANNNTGWTGDSQKVVGDLFLAKLDKNGYYTSSLTAEGTAACAFFDNIAYGDGILYLDGRIQGDGTTMTVGGKEVTASSDYQTMIMASVNASDLSVNYLNTLTSVANSASKFILQNKSAQQIDGYTYYTGMINGSWQKQGSTDLLIDNSTSTKLKGYVLKVDNATGEVKKAYVKDDGGIGGYFGVYVGTEYTYAYGYDMNVGAIITILKNDYYSKLETKTICTYGTVANCATPIIDGDNFVMMNRGKSSASFLNTDKTFATTNWGTVYYSYKIDDTATDINTVAADTQDAYDVYTIDGVRVKNASNYEEAVNGLPKGIYIVGGKKVVVK